MTTCLFEPALTLTRAWRFVAAWFLVLGALAATALWFVIPSSTVRVNVRWREGVTDEQRTAYERQLHLNDGQQREGATWQYSLMDYSPENIGLIVGNQDVADTQYVNRITFQPDDVPSSRIRKVAWSSAAIGGIGSILLALAVWAQIGLSGAILAGLAGVLFLAFAYVRNMDLVSDEAFHYPQIVQVFHPAIPSEPRLLIHSVIPGYHVTVAVLALLFNTIAIADVRLISFAIALVTIALFHKLARRLSGDSLSASLKTANFALLPIVFPFELLIYTEMLALLLLLAGFLLLMRGRYVWAGAAASLSLLVRQNLVIWVVFFLFVIWNDAFGRDWKRSTIVPFVKATWTFFVGGLFFVVFVIVNGGVAMGDVEMQPAFTLHTGNVFLLLFTAGVLLLPLHASNVRAMVDYLKGGRKWRLLSGLAALLLVYALTYENTHPYNTDFVDYYLHNMLLVLSTSSMAHRIVFFIPVALAVISGTVTLLKRQSYYYLYPATALFLVPSWLVDPRYYVFPFALFILFKEDDSPWILWTTLALSLCVSSYILWRTHTGMFFI